MVWWTQRSELLKLLDSIGASAEIFDENVAIEFPRRAFLFTGRLAMGSRKTVESAVVARDGKVASSVSNRLDYLIVGVLGTDAWQFSRYGRKIEAAMENKRSAGRNRSGLVMADVCNHTRAGIDVRSRS